MCLLSIIPGSAYLNSRLGANKFPSGRQREFAGKHLMYFAVLASKTALFEHDRKNSRFDGVVTNATDPLYFAVPNPNSPNLGASPFLGGEIGFTPASANPPILGASGMSIGIAPFAAPMGPPLDNNATASYALCANLPGNGLGLTLVPSVAAFYAIATDGEMRLEAPLDPTTTLVCPF